MKTLACTLLLAFTSVFCMKAQLNLKHNGIRTGDEIIKQQVEYKEPGEAGINRIWDFSKLKTINDSYTLTYDIPPLQGDSLYIMGDNHFLKRDVKDDELVVGTEHNTMYYHRMKNDSLYLLGHENPAVRLTYTKPIVYSVYPLNYGEHSFGVYISEGLYSGTVDIATQGHVRVEADAFGKMILPTGDTLNPVLRIKTTKLILDKDIQYSQSNDLSTDTTTIIQSKGKQMETCQWFTKGYRYPVFETIRNINLDDNTEIFSTAFFFPLQDHFYLDNDPENLAILDSLWNVEQNKHQTNQIISPLTTKGFSYNFYPNPVESQLTVEYYLEKPADVAMTIYSMEGRLVKNIAIGKMDKGLHTEYIDCTNLAKGTYILRIQTNNNLTGDNLIKK